MIAFTTVVRGAPTDAGGELVLLDWESKTVTASVPIRPREPKVDDPNPRGNSRGGRGIALVDDTLWVGAYHSVQSFDANLRPGPTVTHPLMVGVHEVHQDQPGRLWVAATAVDAALEVDLSTGALCRQFWPREHPELQERLGLVPLDIDKTVDNRLRYLGGAHILHPGHLHLNAIAARDGEVYALLPRIGLVVNLSRGEVAYADDALRSGHNLVFDDDHAFSCDTAGGGVLCSSISTGERVVRVDLTAFDWVGEMLSRHRRASWHRRLARRLTRAAPLSRPLFVRGLQVQGPLAWVGVSPASILLIDWQRQELLDVYQYSDDVGVCIHGLKLLPTWGKARSREAPGH